MLILNDVPGGALADRVGIVSMLSSETTGMPSTESTSRAEKHREAADGDRQRAEPGGAGHPGALVSPAGSRPPAWWPGPRGRGAPDLRRAALDRGARGPPFRGRTSRRRS